MAPCGGRTYHILSQHVDHAPPGSDEQRSGRVTKLLVADDDKAIADGLSIYGRKRRFEVFTAYRGDDALAIAQAEKPEIILLDIMMPGLDGRDVMKNLKDAGISEESVVIFITARDSQSDRIVGLQLGAAEYEAKPLHFGRLFDKIDRLLAKRKAGEI